MLQIKLGRDLPPDVVIHLPEEWLTLEPETCYSLSMSWTPMQQTALRETIRFTDDKRGRFEVIVVLKTTMVRFKIFNNHLNHKIYNLHMLFIQLIYARSLTEYKKATSQNL